MSKRCIEEAETNSKCEVEYNAMREELRNNLKKEDRKKLNKMIDCIFETIKIGNLQSFASGFSLAMSLNADNENKDN